MTRAEELRVRESIARFKALVKAGDIELWSPPARPRGPALDQVAALLELYAALVRAPDAPAAALERIVVVVASEGRRALDEAETELEAQREVGQRIVDLVDQTVESDWHPLRTLLLVTLVLELDGPPSFDRFTDLLMVADRLDARALAVLTIRVLTTCRRAGRALDELELYMIAMRWSALGLESEDVDEGVADAIAEELEELEALGEPLDILLLDRTMQRAAELVGEFDILTELPLREPGSGGFERWLEAVLLPLAEVHDASIVEAVLGCYLEWLRGLRPCEEYEYDFDSLVLPNWHPDLAIDLCRAASEHVHRPKPLAGMLRSLADIFDSNQVGHRVTLDRLIPLLEVALFWIDFAPRRLFEAMVRRIDTEPAQHAALLELRVALVDLAATRPEGDDDDD